MALWITGASGLQSLATRPRRCALLVEAASRSADAGDTRDGTRDALVTGRREEMDVPSLSGPPSGHVDVQALDPAPAVRLVPTRPPSSPPPVLMDVLTCPCPLVPSRSINPPDGFATTRRPRAAFLATQASRPMWRSFWTSAAFAFFEAWASLRLMAGFPLLIRSCYSGLVLMSSEFVESFPLTSRPPGRTILAC